jgi:hypothetical protein
VLLDLVRYALLLRIVEVVLRSYHPLGESEEVTVRMSTHWAHS